MATLRCFSTCYQMTVGPLSDKWRDRLRQEFQFPGLGFHVWKWGLRRPWFRSHQCDSLPAHLLMALRRDRSEEEKGHGFLQGCSWRISVPNLLSHWVLCKDKVNVYTFCCWNFNRLLFSFLEITFSCISFIRDSHLTGNSAFTFMEL